ncbi:M56 family metallopeptidase [Telluribacter humicola]|uniref:M56 family metallopeptidase n=1 Tax=Telluribacter humicola TaxID=1720261 RepID=UPI001A95E9F1|nr:M56 family metallopeptidase [Telluribacter humicola]
MITYLVKSVLCSVLLLLFYRVLLEKEKMFRFNRVYLLGSLVLSVVLPLVPLEILLEEPLFPTPSSVEPVIEDGRPVPYTVQLLPEPVIADSFRWEWMCWALYLSVAGWLLVRFGWNINRLRKCIRENEVRVQEGFILVLLRTPTVPHSFLNYIFLTREEYLSGTLQREILVHEMAHVRQQHSLDVLFVELLKTLFWFNPAFYYYRNAIALNHEFLADASVLAACQDVPSYQHLLLEKVLGPVAQPFISKFNYSFTKKRFVMMNKHTSRSRALLAQLSVLPLLVVLFFACSDFSVAQVPPPPPPVPAPIGQLSSADLVKEYNELVEKYIDRDKFNYVKMPSAADAQRMEALISAMSKEQVASLEYIIHTSKPLPRITPSESDYEKYKDSKMYGVWINEKKVPNSELNKYEASDFSQVFVSKLYPNAQKTIGYKYKYQLDLMTTDYYEAYRKETLENPRKYIVLNRNRDSK